MTSELSRAVRDSYEAGAASWATGPEKVYLRLAESLVTLSPTPLEGRTALDLGAGTGVVSRVAVAHGCSAVALDLAWGMLRHEREVRPPGVVGDALHVPFASDAFDAVMSAFCINHIPDPAAAFREMARVTRPEGVVLASTFASARPHPAKVTIQAVLREHGFEPPAWYEEFQERTAPVSGDPSALGEVARAGGLVDVEVHDVEVDAGLDDPRLAVEWRLGMPHTIGFVEAQPVDEQARLRDDCVARLGTGLPAAVSVLFLVARVA